MARRRGSASGTVTWPLLLPVTMVVMLFSIIQTFADFQLVYVLTGGGPANATQLFATYAYQIGVGTGRLSQGAAISLAMFPFLLIVVVVQLLYIGRSRCIGPSSKARKAALGILLHAARQLHFLAVVSILLDAGHSVLPFAICSDHGCAELHAVLDRASYA